MLPMLPPHNGAMNQRGVVTGKVYGRAVSQIKTGISSRLVTVGINRCCSTCVNMTICLFRTGSANQQIRDMSSFIVPNIRRQRTLGTSLRIGLLWKRTSAGF